ncbi:Rossmann-like and DUF2520 domain-containing protein [Altibacter sp. HG106]|uniref:Rossmann-like and DUF2520 domain-containing protein n=1 Tax=Altibacter sp. HG106 TaxID=3023937 RepID=UPI00234FB723|nr:DUF2520 domain-containing protein [Altibacter sp. HG106]MDC7993693.1 DUF2520 domain-containing protein [Altibacter sp. HG106]
MIRVSIIGFGNVGTHLYTAFSDGPMAEVVAVYSRNPQRFDGWEDLPVVSDFTSLPEVDCTLIAVADDAIAAVSSALSTTAGLVAHTSGNAPLDAIDEKHRSGVFYPLQSFSKRPVAFSTIPICLEAETEASYQLLTTLASSLSERVVRIDSAARARLHLAAVFANNFVNHLYSVSEKILAEHELDFSLLHPLILETAQRLSEVAPSEAQTGPAVREDQQTIKKQLHLLNDSAFQALYQQLTKSIATTHGKKL